MIIVPSPEDQPSVANMVELVRLDSKRRIDVTLLDSDGNNVDIVEATQSDGDPKGELSVEITDLGGGEVVSDTYWPIPIPDTRRLKHPSTGRYYIELGDEDNETSNAGTYLANWHARIDATSEDEYRTQVIEIVSPKTLALLPHLRLLIDKAWKIVSPSDACYLGYTDSQLALYLVAGLHFINSFPPYPAFRHLDMFPSEYYSEILVKSALYCGLQSQLTFAIDTDTPSFSASGYSFVLQHATPLASYMNHLYQDLSKRIVNFKLKLVQNGSVGVEMKFDLAYSALLNMAPFGSLFNSLFVAY